MSVDISNVFQQGINCTNLILYTKIKTLIKKIFKVQ